MRATAVRLVLLAILAGFALVACARSRTAQSNGPGASRHSATETTTVQARPPTNFEKLVGTWLGERPEGPRIRRWLVSWRRDGSFEVRSKEYEGNAIATEREEYGTWAADDARYVTRTREAVNEDGISTPPQPWIDLYRIVELTESTFTYEDVTKGVRYTVRRVSDDFEFP